MSPHSVTTTAESWWPELRWWQSRRARSSPRNARALPLRDRRRRHRGSVAFPADVSLVPAVSLVGRWSLSGENAEEPPHRVEGAGAGEKLRVAFARNPGLQPFSASARFGLESRCTPRGYRGFESHPLRQPLQKLTAT